MMEQRISCCYIALLLSNAFLATAFTSMPMPVVTPFETSHRLPSTARIVNHQSPMSSTSLAAESDRRRLIASSLASIFIYPTIAQAGIDVSGLAVQGSSSPNSDLASQLKQAQYNDGSAARRVQDIRTTTNPASAKPTARVNAPPPVGVATWALRATEPSFGKLNFGTTSRYQGRIVGPASSRSSFAINFDFPADWLQLDKFNGCIQFVDQRNGDKLYVMRLTLPSDDTLATIPKQFFAKALFDPEGSLVTSGGLTVEDGRVSKEIAPPDCPATDSCGRRLLLKFATVTGNGLRVERRGIIQAYATPGDSNDVYMLVTSSNAVKFEKGGIERDTVENIANSFRIDFV